MKNIFYKKSHLFIKDLYKLRKAESLPFPTSEKNFRTKEEEEKYRPLFIILHNCSFSSFYTAAPNNVCSTILIKQIPFI